MCLLNYDKLSGIMKLWSGGLTVQLPSSQNAKYGPESGAKATSSNPSCLCYVVPCKQFLVFVESVNVEHSSPNPVPRFEAELRSGLKLGDKNCLPFVCL